MRKRLRLLSLAVILAALPFWGMDVARAEQGSLIVVANDVPITEYDITQKINLLKILNSMPPGAENRKVILRSLVDDVVKIAEAERLKIAPTAGEIEVQIARIAKNMKLDKKGLLERLKAKGVSGDFFRRYLSAQMGFSRVVGAQNRKEVTVTDAQVDAKLAEIKANMNAQLNKIMADPRMKAITVYKIVEINLPLENNDPGLLQARAVDAMQVVRQFKGCGNVRAAGAGVFNVKYGKVVEADGARLPPPLKQAMDKAGAGRAIGPVRSPSGMQVIGFCGTRRMTPPKPNFEMPTRDQVKNLLTNEQYGAIENGFLKEARKRVYIEYRDQSYAQ